MTASLTTLIGKVQGLLLDGGTNYSTATCTNAIRQALYEFNTAAPRFAAEQLTVVADQNEYELTSGDFDAGVIDVLSVHLFDDDGDDEEPLDYTDHTEDNRAYIRLKEAQAEGEILLIGFSTPNTINGLDSATVSTIPDIFDQVIVDGGAYYAIAIRSVGRVEPINLNKDVPKLLKESAQRFLTAFEAGKKRAGQRKARPAKQDPTWKFQPKGF